MSLIIEALRRAQQLRLKDDRGIPFLKSRQPPEARRRRSSGKRRLLQAAGLVLLILLLVVAWDPVALFRRERSTPSLAVPEKPLPILAAKEETEVAEEVLLLSKVEARKELPGEGTLETKKEVLLPRRLENGQKPEIAKSLKKGLASGGSLPGKPAEEPLKTSPPTMSEATLRSPDDSPRPVNLHFNSTEMEVLFNQGVLYQDRKQTAKAFEAYQKVIERDPGYFEAYNNLGLLYQEIGDFERALQAYQRSIEINPRYGKAHNNLGILFYLNDRHDEAIEAFQKCVVFDPENSECYLNLGILFKKQGEWSKGLDCFHKVFVNNPFYGEAHYNIALLYEEMGQLDFAMDHYQKFIQLSSKTYPALISKVQRHLDDLSKRKREKDR